MPVNQGMNGSKQEKYEAHEMKPFIHHDRFQVSCGTDFIFNNAVMRLSFLVEFINVLAVLYKFADKLNTKPFVKLRLAT